MRFQLKRVSINQRLSEETIAFAADVWIDGKHAGEARNNGGGGETVVRLHLLSQEQRAAVLQWLAVQPPHVFKADPSTGSTEDLSVTLTLDLLIDNLVVAHQITEDKKRWCKTKVVFRLKADAPGQYRTIKKDNGAFAERQRAWLTRTYGAQLEEIVNDALKGVNP